MSKPRLMLINDSDTQVRWWMRIKDDWKIAQANNKSFLNALSTQTLRWRS